MIMRLDPEPSIQDVPERKTSWFSRYDWLIRVWGVVALFVIVMVIWSHHVGVPIRDPRGSYLIQRPLVSLVIFAVLVVIDAALRCDRGARRGRDLIAKLRSRWPKDRLALALSGLVAYHIVYLTYHNLKSWVVFNGYRDAALERVDSWLFLGHSPAVMLHDLLGQHTAAIILAIVYETFSYIVPVSFVAALVFADRIRVGYVFLMSTMWAWILGVGSYYLIPSLGPFATSSADFDQLTHTFINSRQDALLDGRAQLLSDPSAHDSFAAIGAFASLHTGFTFVIVLGLRYYGLRRASHVMTVFLLATLTATIYFGYHFVVDDLAGLVLGLLAVALGKLVIFPKGRDAEISP